MSTETTQPEKVEYDDARDRGSVLSEGGYHQPGTNEHMQNCGCSLDTDKGAYKDVTVRVDGQNVHFYHHSPVVVQRGDTFRLDSCGWRTSSTKERINRHTPPGYKVVQRDGDWFLETPEGREEFRDGMTITE